MESCPEANARRAELAREAPVAARGVWRRVRFDGREAVFLCGTIGAAFDTWQRRLSALSAADAFLSQQIGLEAVEKAMDELEKKAKVEVEAEGWKMLPRKSPGYGNLPIELSREIINCLDATKKIGVSITDSNLLVPSKSVTAICEIC